MTLVSNDPSWWPLINADFIASYVAVAAFVGVMYDWGLTFGQEVELIWRQRWSLMTFIYLGVRYAGMGYAVTNILLWVPTIQVMDIGCNVINGAIDWTREVVDVLLGVIIIARLYAMYQRSRKMLIFLIVVFLAIRITNAVIVAIMMTQVSGEEAILSGTYQCMMNYMGDFLFLMSMTWILATVWEVLALCLALWITVKHFRELRKHSRKSMIGDCFRVLMKTHASYFASFVAVSCLEMGYLSPTLPEDRRYLESQIYAGFTQISIFVQIFVLGPRLILGVRECSAEFAAEVDTTTVLTSIAFQEHLHIETSSSV